MLWSESISKRFLFSRSLLPLMVLPYRTSDLNGVRVIFSRVKASADPGRDITAPVTPQAPSGFLSCHSCAPQTPTQHSQGKHHLSHSAFAPSYTTVPSFCESSDFTKESYFGCVRTQCSVRFFTLFCFCFFPAG